MVTNKQNIEVFKCDLTNFVLDQYIFKHTVELDLLFTIEKQSEYEMAISLFRMLFECCWKNTDKDWKKNSFEDLYHTGELWFKEEEFSW